MNGKIERMDGREKDVRDLINIIFLIEFKNERRGKY